MCSTPGYGETNLGDLRGDSFSQENGVRAWNLDGLVGSDAVLAFTVTSNLDASHLRAFQRYKAVFAVAVVSDVGHQISVGAHVHVVRLDNLVFVLGISKKIAKTTTEGKNRSMEVESVRGLA